jgi:hypothetical protein
MVIKLPKNYIVNKYDKPILGYYGANYFKPLFDKITQFIFFEEYDALSTVSI